MVNNSILKASLLTLCFSFTFGNSFSDYTLASNYTLDTIKSLKVKTTCQILSDCSEDALECRKGNNGNKSYCVYPEYICSGNDTCYLLNNRTMSDDSSFINTLNNTTSECTKDEECLSNKCAEGKCQMSIDSLLMYCKTTESLDSTVYQCGKLIGDHCENNSDCITSKCDPNSKICLKNDTTNTSNSTSKKSNTTLYVVIAIGVIIGIFLIAAIIYACGQSIEYMDENPEIKEMREENKNAAGVLIIAAM